MKKKVIITIPDPCRERWDTMTPVKGGRHCTTCSKVVNDFSLYTDQQLPDFITRNASGGCGLLTAEQLNRPLQRLQPQLLSSLNGRRLAASFLVLQTFAVTAMAQMKETARQHTSAPSLQVGWKYTIKGKLIDYATMQPVQNRAIHTKEGYTAVTDKSGQFILRLPQIFHGDSIIIFSESSSDESYISSYFYEQLDVHSNKEITVYCYPQEIATEMNVIIEDAHIVETDTPGGFMSMDTTYRHPSLWKRIIRCIRKKRE